MHIRVIGEVVVSVAGHPILLPTRKDRALLVYLALTAGRKQARERVAQLLWADRCADARHSLRQSLSSITRALRKSAVADVLKTDREFLWLESNRISVDLFALKRSLVSRAIEELEKALDLAWTPILPGLEGISAEFDGWIVLERARLAAVSTKGYRVLRDLHAAVGNPEAAPDEFLRASVHVLEQMPDCVVVTDLDGRIIGWNQWARRKFGYEKREVVGRKPSFLYGPGADASVTAQLIDTAIRQGRWSGVLRLYSKDGSSRLQKRTMLPLRDDRGRVVGVFGVTRPLTRPIPGL